MGMSTHIEAFMPDTDKEYQKHKKVLLACANAGVSLPKETQKYFGEEEPEDYLLDERLEITLKKGIHYKEYSSDSREGFEVDLKSLPEGVTKLRFFNAY